MSVGELAIAWFILPHVFGFSREDLKMRCPTFKETTEKQDDLLT